MKILIVDDSKPFRNALGAILREAGYFDLVVVESAMEAIKFLHSSDQRAAGTNVDLILMDIMMPEIDGIEAVREIKASKDLRDIPIVMVSTQDEEEKIERAFDAGAIDYISKPIKKLELRARVRSILKLKEEMDRRKAHERELEVLNRSLEAANKELQRLSNLDGLTGIANRRYFDEVMGKEWRRAARNRKPLSLIMADIDFFKAFNDHYGHVEGDFCLKQIATALASASKRPGDLLARYGGEEFVALLPNTENEGARRVAEVMQWNVTQLDIEHSRSLISNCVTVSIGLSTIIPEQSLEPSALIEAADKALYKAKEHGRNQIREGPVNFEGESY